MSKTSARKNQPTTKIGVIIKAVHEDNIQSLSGDEILLMERLSAADDFIRLYGVGKKSRQMLMEKFNVTQHMADVIMRDAQMFYGSTSIYEKSYWKSFAVEQLVKVINATQKSFLDENGSLKKNITGRELKALAELLKELRNTIGYDKEETNVDLGDDADVLILTTDIQVLGLKPTGLSREQILERFHRSATQVNDGQ